LRRRTQTKKLTQNPDLNFVGNSPYFQNGVQVKEPFEVFEGLGYFSHKDYDFEVGRARIEANPKNQPDFDPNWVEAYRLSPTVDPSKTARNVMPRDSNPDPRGYMKLIRLTTFLSHHSWRATYQVSKLRKLRLKKARKTWKMWKIKKRLR
jgi:hypothetical protein